MPFVVQPLSDGLLFDSAHRLTAAALAGDADPLASLGWGAVLVPAAAGGVDGTLQDLCAIVEGLALHGLRLPVIERCAIAPLLLQGVDAERAEPVLQAIAQGDAVQPLVNHAAGFVGAWLRATRTDAGWRLQGCIEGVDDSLPALSVLALAETDAGPALFHLPSEGLPAPVARYRGMDGVAAADHVWDVDAPLAACLAQGEAVRAAVARAQDAALLAICVDTVASAGAGLSDVIAYLATRVQFGAALSGQQALRHRVADAYVRYESARGIVTRLLARTEGDVPPAARELALAKCALGETGRLIAEEIIQLHGGMGMSEETPAARLATRLLANEFRYGDRWRHATALCRVLAGEGVVGRPALATEEVAP